jgi:hypothetical protein
MSRIWSVTGVLLVVAIVIDLLLGIRPPGQMAVYGFVGCVVIIVVSKWFGKLFVQRREGYYTPQGGVTRETGGLPEQEAGDG